MLVHPGLEAEYAIISPDGQNLALQVTTSKANNVAHKVNSVTGIQSMQSATEGFPVTEFYTNQQIKMATLDPSMLAYVDNGTLYVRNGGGYQTFPNCTGLYDCQMRATTKTVNGVTYIHHVTMVSCKLGGNNRSLEVKWGGAEFPTQKEIPGNAPVSMTASGAYIGYTSYDGNNTHIVDSQNPSAILKTVSTPAVELSAIAVTQSNDVTEYCVIYLQDYVVTVVIGDERHNLDIDRDDGGQDFLGVYVSPDMQYFVVRRLEKLYYITLADVKAGNKPDVYDYSVSAVVLYNNFNWVAASGLNLYVNGLSVEWAGMDDSPRSITRNGSGYRLAGGRIVRTTNPKTSTSAKAARLFSSTTTSDNGVAGVLSVNNNSNILRIASQFNSITDIGVEIKEDNELVVDVVSADSGVKPEPRIVISGTISETSNDFCEATYTLINIDEQYKFTSKCYDGYSTGSMLYVLGPRVGPFLVGCGNQYLPKTIKLNVDAQVLGVYAQAKFLMGALLWEGFDSRWFLRVNYNQLMDLVNASPIYHTMYESYFEPLEYLEDYFKWE